jgi:hypothetical protein
MADVKRSAEHLRGQAAACSAVILCHPTFDRPVVQPQPVRPGRKRNGVYAISTARARRKNREAEIERLRSQIKDGRDRINGYERQRDFLLGKILGSIEYLERDVARLRALGGGV